MYNNAKVPEKVYNKISDSSTPTPIITDRIQIKCNRKSTEQSDTIIRNVRNKKPGTKFRCFVARKLCRYNSSSSYMENGNSSSFKMILFMMNPHIYYDHHHHIKVQYIEIRTRMEHEE